MTQADTPPHTDFRITGWHALAYIVAFFAVVIGVDVSFAVIAYRTHPGEVSVTPYEDGLLYDRQIAQMRAQERLGWEAGAQARPHGVRVLVRDRAGRPLPGLAIVGKLERPATETGRLTPRFVETAPGRYDAVLAGVSGAWDLTAQARDRSGHAFQLERRLTWP
ncbi:FixH family protein [Phenylobacterium sp.]|uniref:FixH family protein n=1 Tax=Phenylobacterium sp. TaxID=1871053 RepID=UPI002600861C|nr:FixH family protein [Phenylobacterium sp.]